MQHYNKAKDNNGGTMSDVEIRNNKPEIQARIKKEFPPRKIKGKVDMKKLSKALRMKLPA
jgi:ribosomal protein S30